MQFFHFNIQIQFTKSLGQSFRLVGCLLAIFLFAHTAYGQTIELQVVTKTINEIVDYESGNQVVIEGEKAEVEVVTWSKNQVAVEMELIAKHPDRATAETDLEDMKYEIVRKGNQILIRNFIDKKEGKKTANLKAHYVVSVPSDCPVVLSNYFGKTNIKNLGNGLNINSEFCQIGLSNIKGEIGIKTRFGDLEGEEISGDVNIEARRSNVTLSNLGGKFDITVRYHQNFCGSIEYRYEYQCRQIRCLFLRFSAQWL